MSKKIISMLMLAVVATSLIGCKSNKEQSNNNTSTVSMEESYENLEGPWATDLTLKEFDERYADLLKKVKDKTEEYGLKYTEEEVVREDNNSYINVTNEGAKKNKLESMDFGRKFFGSDLTSGQITMKILMNFDGEKALSENSFKFEDTSLAKYSAIFSGEEKRDYSEINSKILDTLKSEKGEGVFQSSINGLYEEFVVSKEYIVYTLKTKKFEFVKEN